MYLKVFLDLYVARIVKSPVKNCVMVFQEGCENVQVRASIAQAVTVKVISNR